MADYKALQASVQELAQRAWDTPALEAKIQSLMKEGIPKSAVNQDDLVANKAHVLDRVQQRAEEYNFILKNCAQSTALALMETFGLGNLDIIKALAPFPGFGGTGWMCGGVTGGLMALGLYFGSDDMLNLDAVGATMMAARTFMARFEERVGAVLCPKIHENVVFGRYMDPGAGPENMAAFAAAQGFEKCSLLPGIGARLAAEIILTER